MTLQLLIAGGGLGGLAAALACARVGLAVDLHERAPAFSEVGAGIQLGPNAVRLLQGWGLGDALHGAAARPRTVRVLRARDGVELARMDLGKPFESRYGAPYLTIHRADLQQVLVEHARASGAVLALGSRVIEAIQQDDGVTAWTESRARLHADAVVAADGIWSSLRGTVVSDPAPRSTGHVAYRSLAPLSELPAACRSDEVRAWLGPHMHVLAYPVRRGDSLNVVALVEGEPPGDGQGWDHEALAAELRRAMGPVCGTLQEVIDAMPSWRLWALHDREPVRGPQEMARGRIALLGDAAHPMLPYLAQGAGMAIEDADVLAQVLSATEPGRVESALARYADLRWHRCAQVQARARRNGRVFHATGPLQWSRDAAMRVVGERLIDQPWLYR
jgi:salicylate hydroxylase